MPPVTMSLTEEDDTNAAATLSDGVHTVICSMGQLLRDSHTCRPRIEDHRLAVVDQRSDHSGDLSLGGQLELGPNGKGGFVTAAAYPGRPAVDPAQGPVGLEQCQVPPHCHSGDASSADRVSTSTLPSSETLWSIRSWRSFGASRPPHSLRG